MADGPNSEYVVVLTTLETRDHARALVRRLVEERLVACGTIVTGTTSIYRWEGQVTEAEEAVVLMKTPRERWAALASAIGRHHPYEVPELLAIPVEAGLESYLKWVKSETMGESERSA